MDEWTRIVGERLHQRRMERGLSLRELGEKAGVTFTAIGQIERGMNGATGHTLFKLGKALGVSMDWFYSPIKQTAKF